MKAPIIKLIDETPHPLDGFTLEENILAGRQMVVRFKTKHGKYEWTCMVFKSMEHLNNYERMQLRDYGRKVVGVEVYKG